MPQEYRPSVEVVSCSSADDPPSSRPAPAAQVNKTASNGGPMGRKGLSVINWERTSLPVSTNGKSII
jgi:hypothetical protein